MAAHAHYPQHNAPPSGVHVSTVATFLIWVTILAAAVWFVGSVVGEDVGSIVTTWFMNW
jgi:hypothetical protein